MVNMNEEENNTQMEVLLRKLFPDIVVPYLYIYQTLSFLEETQVNPQILPTIIRAIHNISIGSGRGQVIVHVVDKVVNVSIREQSKEVNTKVVE
mgnify:CR=1 FL=1